MASVYQPDYGVKIFADIFTANAQYYSEGGTYCGTVGKLHMNGKIGSALDACSAMATATFGSI